AGCREAERTAADGFSAALRGRAGVERDCARDRAERGHGESAPFAGSGQSARGVGGEAMSLKSGLKGLTGETAKDTAQDPVLDAEFEQALKNFRLSVHAWSDELYNRPRTALAVAPRRKVWRLAAGWALGCALVVGGVSGGVYERNHQRELARIAAVREAEHQRQLAEQKAREEEELMAMVDNDVAR